MRLIWCDMRIIFVLGVIAFLKPSMSASSLSAGVGMVNSVTSIPSRRAALIERGTHPAVILCRGDDFVARFQIDAEEQNLERL